MRNKLVTHQIGDSFRVGDKWLELKCRDAAESAPNIQITVADPKWYRAAIGGRRHRPLLRLQPGAAHNISTHITNLPTVLSSRAAIVGGPFLRPGRAPARLLKKRSSIEFTQVAPNE